VLAEEKRGFLRIILQTWKRGPNYRNNGSSLWSSEMRENLVLACRDHSSETPKRCEIMFNVSRLVRQVLSVLSHRTFQTFCRRGARRLARPCVRRRASTRRCIRLAKLYSIHAVIISRMPLTRLSHPMPFSHRFPVPLARCPRNERRPAYRGRYVPARITS